MGQKMPLSIIIIVIIVIIIIFFSDAIFLYCVRSLDVVPRRKGRKPEDLAPVSTGSVLRVR